MTDTASLTSEPSSGTQLTGDQVQTVRDTLIAVLEIIEYLQQEALRCASSVGGDHRDRPGTEAQRVVIAEMWGWEMGASFVLGRIEDLLGDALGLRLAVAGAPVQQGHDGAPGPRWQGAAPRFLVDAWTEVYERDHPRTPSPGEPGTAPCDALRGLRGETG